MDREITMQHITMLLNHQFHSIFLLTSLILLAGCASSMTPSQFNQQMPQKTQAKFYDHSSVDIALSSGHCKLLHEKRKYTAPIAFTVQGDLKNGALGIDQWVREDGGNAYSIDNYEWVSVGNDGDTQLAVYFNTLICE